MLDMDGVIPVFGGSPGPRTDGSAQKSRSVGFSVT